MLSELNIKNFALIDELSLTFEPGFNVLTGETGAGKSIIVGAINLILGGRASSDLIRRGKDEAEVQALFLPKPAEIWSARLEEMGLPPGGEIIIRRVLARSGRNRVYINGAMTTLAQLGELANDLMAISGQHEHQQLLDPDRQLLYLDQFGGLLEDRTAMTVAFEHWQKEAARLASLKRRIKEAREKAELYEFQVKEIDEAELVSGEDEELEKERNLARNAEKIFSRVRGAYEILYEQNGAIIESLDVVRRDVEQAADMDDRLAPTRKQIQESYHNLDDAAATLRSHLDHLTFDPERLEEVESRLALLQRLTRKYGPGLDDVISYAQRAAGRLDDISEMEFELKDLAEAVETAKTEALKKADGLSKKRKKSADGMAKALAAELRSLGMPKLKFAIEMDAARENGNLGPVGWDHVDFLVSPNLGEELMPLARIASGGELSRTMLGLKGLLAGLEKVQTVIFDEVDTGIGGAVAEVVGRKLKGLSEHHQLLCITHLPQIAVFGGHHHRVFKEERGDRTVTDIQPLGQDQRLEEIAGMLGGAAPTDKTLEAAREMLAKGGG